MKKARYALAGFLALVLSLGSLAAQPPEVSEKKDVAVFALGYYGWNIPYEALGSIDQEIQKVFVDLGRFHVIGVTQRMSSSGLDSFIATLKKAKEKDFVVPEKYQFGEATLTEAEFNKLLGAFIVAAPVVSEFDVNYDRPGHKWLANIKTNVTFIDVADGGSVIGVAEVQSSGSDKSAPNRAVSNAIDAIPLQLQFEIRKIEAFQISTRVLSASGDEIKLQLGSNMGIKKGDEYSIVTSETVEGFRNDSERGLVEIKDVGSQVSTGRIVYSDIAVTKDVQLKEIPRLGYDAEPYFHMAGRMPIPGLRVVMSRGYYGFKPYAAVQIPVGEVSSYFYGLLSVIPINGVAGAEFDLNLGRLTLSPSAGVGVSYARVVTPVGSNDDTDWLSHIGAQAYVRASYRFSRDMSAFAEAGLEGWLPLSSYFESYGGLGWGAGVTIKL